MGLVGYQSFLIVSKLCFQEIHRQKQIFITGTASSVQHQMKTISNIFKLWRSMLTAWRTKNTTNDKKYNNNKNYGQTFAIQLFVMQQAGQSDDERGLNNNQKGDASPFAIVIDENLMKTLTRITYTLGIWIHVFVFVFLPILRRASWQRCKADGSFHSHWEEIQDHQIIKSQTLKLVSEEGISPTWCCFSEVLPANYVKPEIAWNCKYVFLQYNVSVQSLSHK